MSRNVQYGMFNVRYGCSKLTPPPAQDVDIIGPLKLPRRPLSVAVFLSSRSHKQELKRW